jgi:hypothetical protein
LARKSDIYEENFDLGCLKQTIIEYKVKVRQYAKLKKIYLEKALKY